MPKKNGQESDAEIKKRVRDDLNNYGPNNCWWDMAFYDSRKFTNRTMKYNYQIEMK